MSAFPTFSIRVLVAPERDKAMISTLIFGVWLRSAERRAWWWKTERFVCTYFGPLVGMALGILGDLVHSVIIYANEVYLLSKTSHSFYAMLTVLPCTVDTQLIKLPRRSIIMACSSWTSPSLPAPPKIPLHAQHPHHPSRTYIPNIRKRPNLIHSPTTTSASTQKQNPPSPPPLSPPTTSSPTFHTEISNISQATTSLSYLQRT